MTVMIMMIMMIMGRSRRQHRHRRQRLQLPPQGLQLLQEVSTSNQQRSFLWDFAFGIHFLISSI